MPAKLLTEAQESEIAELYKAKTPTKEIANVYGLRNTFTIYQALKRQGVVATDRNFTDAEEAEIAKIYRAGHSAKAIMRAYGFKHHECIMGALRRQGVIQRPAPERNRLYALNPHAFDVLDEQACYWWGFLYADGCIGRRTLILIVASKDKAHLERLRDFMQSASPIREKNVSSGYGMHPAAKIEFTDRHLVARLAELGIVTGRPFPERVTQHLPVNMLNHWLRGFL